ncbi:MAG TPA: OB-fold domain-containing protein, partial [Candidatus Limnocylindrales bacterium]|nr:OB-fold domain-containing protein [Candidatus Limnocylindrales bacterium]
MGRGKGPEAVRPTMGRVVLFQEQRTIFVQIWIAPRSGAQRHKEMIAHLRGRLISKHPNQAIVEAAGVGYEVNITIPTFSELPALGAEVALFIHTHVREDALSLFGFLKPEEKQLFEKL